MSWYKLSQSVLSSRLLTLSPEMAAVAQKVYDEWEQDGSGNDERLGTGGICQDVAEAMADVLIKNGINTYHMDSQVGEQHVWVIAYNDVEAYHVDIPADIYETGGGYNWNKTPDIQIDETDVSILKADKETLEFVKNES